jgi:hypothetical protein
VANREELYAKFIQESTNLYIDSLGKTLESAVSLIGMYSLVGRMRLIAGDKVLLAPERIAETIVESWGQRATWPGRSRSDRDLARDP